MCDKGGEHEEEMVNLQKEIQASNELYKISSLYLGILVALMQFICAN